VIKPITTRPADHCRARLAASGAHGALAANLHSGDRRKLAAVVEGLARDERVMAAKVCGPGLETVVATKGFPESFSCKSVDLQPAGTSEPTPLEIRGRLRGDPVLISATPVEEDGALLGSLVLVQDLSFAVRRELVMKRVSIAAFALVALLASVFAFVVRREWLRSWTEEFRRLLPLAGRAPETMPAKGGRAFLPLLADVRQLVDELTAERGAAAAPWSPERLHRVLKDVLHDESIVLLANREPYIHERGEADHDTVDRHGRVRVPPGEESYTIRRVWLTREEEQGYYYGFANEGLWPLCHIAHARPEFRASDWKTYREVNQRFAEAVAQEARGPDPVVLVQDYHFALLPRMVRERLPKATIITFWHIPWPNAERFGICPWANDLLTGLLGSSVIGFHTQLHCNNFIESVDRYLEARIDREAQAVVLAGRESLVRSYPISIDWPSRWAEAAPPVTDCRRAVFSELGLAPDALLGVGVDRLDYTKGIEERLLAVERLLERFPHLRGRFTFAQLGAPSRTLIERYRALNDSVEALAARINDRFASGTYRPIVLLRAHHEPSRIYQYFRAADVCYVSSLHDGMNLVAKEFVSARDDDRGVLVLSRFTGAADELRTALLINPHDIDGLKDTIVRATEMPRPERRRRMRALRKRVRENDVAHWSREFLRTLSEHSDASEDPLGELEWTVGRGPRS
jgi:trehalose 6-phosphate synthase